MRAGQQLEAFATIFGLVASLLFHAAVFGYVASRTANFDFDFELTLPMEVEFGLTEGVVAAAAPGGTARRASDEVGDRAAGDEPNPEIDAGVRDADTVAEAGADAGTDADTDADAEIPVGPSAITGPLPHPPRGRSLHFGSI